MAENMSKEVKTKRIKPDGSGWTVVAGTSDVTSDIVDTQGFDGVRFIVGFGAITSGAATSIKVQQDTASDMAGAADLLGSSITVADTDDNKIAISDYIQPQERYVRVITKRATQNSVVDFVLVELYRARSLPISDDTTVVSAELAVSPIEGTA